jgi:hypothetical protein
LIGEKNGLPFSEEYLEKYGLRETRRGIRKEVEFEEGSEA